MEQEDVKFMFVSLIQPCEQIAMPTMILSQMMNVFDERFYDLSNLVEIVEEYMALLEHLTVMAIDCYPWYQSKPQAITCSSGIKMMLALQTKVNSYKPFLYRIDIYMNGRAKLKMNATNAPKIIEKFEKAMKDFTEPESKSMSITLSAKSADDQESNYCCIKENRDDYDTYFISLTAS
ncbi:unnamed protein product [Rotaria socialis]